jgi:hypothetical protein
MTGDLFKINWDQFKVKHENPTKTFEELCYHLFCRRYKLSPGIRVDYNQAGIETHPVLSNGILTGFQSKFFQNKLSDTSSVNQINHSIDNAKKHYPKLRLIIIYTHHSFGADKPAYKMDIEKKARPVKIEWVVESHFQSLLFQPSNLDLSQLYFGHGDEIKFIKNSITARTLTLLQSAEYISLPVSNNRNKNVTNLHQAIKRANAKLFILDGNPGSGKSILMQKLLQLFGGLDQPTTYKMMRVLTTQGAVPVLINLKQCATDSLENIIRARQQDNNVNGNTLDFIYLFDGLDEVAESNIHHVLYYLFELEQKTQTRKIIISCRSGSLNRTRAKSYLKGAVEFSISSVDIRLIELYFHAKGNTARIKKLGLFKKQNKALVSEIKDILVANILWDVIDDLPLNATAIDLIDKKITLLLQNPEHKKDIERLNLLNPKETRIISILEEASFHFQKKFQFRFSISELQGLISKQLPLSDYRGINEILNYIADLFFDADPTARQEQSYIFQHRRFQEFFFTRKLKTEYEKDPKVLRRLRVLSSHDYFESFFLPYLRNEYKKENNLVEFLGLNLIDVYLGNHRGWGADDAYYKDSEQYLHALISQSAINFDHLISDETLDIQGTFLIPKETLEQSFIKFRQKDRNNWHSYDETQYLKLVWETHYANLIQFSALLHANNKQAFAKKIDDHIDEIRAIFRKEKFLQILKKEEHQDVMDPGWAKWEDYLYHQLIVKKKSVSSFYRDDIAKYYRPGQKEHFMREEQGNRKLMKGFLRVCLQYKPEELIRVTNKFDRYQFICMLEVLAEVKFLPFVFRNRSVRTFLLKNITNRTFQSKDFNTYLAFFKKILTGELTIKERKGANDRIKLLADKRKIDLHLDNGQYEFALLSYTTDHYTYTSMMSGADRDYASYYNELAVFSVTFTSYINILNGTGTGKSECGLFNRYNQLATRARTDFTFREGMTNIWAHIFIASTENAAAKKKLAAIVVTEKNNIEPFGFLFIIRQNDKSLFKEMTREPDIDLLAEQHSKREEFYQDHINRCFELSIMYAGINDHKSIEFFLHGINDGIVRHGWRKDHIVSASLIGALEIIVKNNWDTKENLSKYIHQVFNLAIRVRNITDGKGTHYGPVSLIKMIARYDIPLAESLDDSRKEQGWGHSNEAKSVIIQAKIEQGLDPKTLEEESRNIRKSYRYDGKPDDDFYLEKFKVCLALASNEFYDPAERKEAFEKAYQLIEDIILQEYGHVDFKNELEEETDTYKILCLQYNKPFNIPEEKDKDRHTQKEYEPGNEASFRDEINRCRDSSGLKNLYHKLLDRNENVKLRHFETWKILIAKTFSIDKNISQLTKLLKEHAYPHTDYMRSESKFLHYAVAAAIDNLNTKKEIIDYLSTESGHDGFVNTLKAYELLGDKTMCVILFKRFLKFCELLVT